MIAAALASGVVSGAGDLAAGRWFYLALVWLAPLSLSFHLSLLDHPLSSRRRAALHISLGLAAFWSVFLLALPISRLQALGIFSWLRLGVRLSLALALVVGLAGIWRGYRTGLPWPAARRVQLLLLGNLLALAPLLLLSLLPETLKLPVFVPYELTLPWLLLSPLSYLYIGRRRRLSRAGAHLHFFVLYFFLAVISLAIYLITFALTGSPRGSTSQIVLACVLVGVAAVSVSAFVHPELVSLTKWALQGTRATKHALDELAQRLSLAHDPKTLRHIVLHDLPNAFGAPVSLFLIRQGDALRRNLAAAVDQDASELSLPIKSHFVLILEASGRPLTLAALQQAQPDAAWTEDEHALFAHAGVDLIVPLVAGGILQGVLGLGPKLSADAWNSDDLCELGTLGRQAGAALQNLHLLDEVQAGRDELARAHRQLLVNQDHQQRKLAQEIHDGPLQQLLGTSYRLAQLQSESPALTPDPAIIREEVLAVASELRDLIGQLRPAGLTELGLAAALRDYVGRLRQTSPRDAPRLRLHLEPKDPCLPPEVDLCLFRCAQEGVRNALRHARATSVVIELRVLGGEVQLTIEDNGIGFQVPHRLSELAQHDHFGLVGAAERVEWLGGRLRITSELGAGTTLRVILPLSPV